MQLYEKMVLAIIYLALLCVCSGMDDHEAYEQYYITSSTQRSPCPSEPCLTLQQFASTVNTSGHLFINSSLLMFFLPGAHRLNSELLFSNISSVHFITANFSSSATTKDVTIICENVARFVYVTVGSVHMSNLNYSMCKGHHAKSVSLFSVKRCTFHNHTETAT